MISIDLHFNEWPSTKTPNYTLTIFENGNVVKRNWNFPSKWLAQNFTFSLLHKISSVGVFGHWRDEIWSELNTHKNTLSFSDNSLNPPK